MISHLRPDVERQPFRSVGMTRLSQSTCTLPWIEPSSSNRTKTRCFLPRAQGVPIIVAKRSEWELGVGSRQRAILAHQVKVVLRLTRPIRGTLSWVDDL